MKYFIILILLCAVFVGCSSESERSDSSSNSTSQAEPTADVTEAPSAAVTDTTEETTESERAPIFSSVRDVGLYAVEGLDETYAFDYDGVTFQAIYTADNWRVIDSYKITNAVDIELICHALADIHPIHGADMTSYRTASDMAYEWIQHNLAYLLLPADSPWKQNAKDVDINPSDQGKNIYDFYKDRVDNGS